MRMQRREFLMAVGASALVACRPIRCAQGLVRSGFRRVDVHCHVFNADDLAVRGFLENVVFRPYGRLGRGLARALAFALRGGAPGFDKEDALLDALLEGDALPDFPEPPTDEELLNGFVRELRETDRELYLEMLEETDIDPEGLIDPEQALLDTVVMRALRWGRQLTRYRVQILEALFEQYPEVELFTPAMVDMDLWLADRARVPVSKQLVLYGKLARWSAGRAHPMVAYDPRREAAAGDSPEAGSLHWVKQAVLEHGAVGVKVYPPMGFRPIGNSDSAIETALALFYAWCESHAVPVMAHCNRSNGATPGAEESANPLYWRSVLERHPELRLNLGHFGGTAMLRENPDTSWARAIVELMRDYPHVYADSGFHDVALDARPDDVTRYVDALARLRDEFPMLEARALYGSDWQMIMMVENHEDYLDTYTRIWRQRFGDASANAFLGGNALQFLGLRERGSGAHRRLAAFYARHGVEAPPWWEA